MRTAHSLMFGTIAFELLMSLGCFVLDEGFVLIDSETNSKEPLLSLFTIVSIFAPATIIVPSSLSNPAQIRNRINKDFSRVVRLSFFRHYLSCIW